MANILMIDDDKDFSALASAHFTGQGYTFTLTAGGREGLAKAASAKPDLIFLDMMMPDMNGIEVLRELQAGDETAEIPVLIISARFIDQGMLDLFSQERNFRGFVGKPVTFSSLQRTVETILKK